jgi:hypothetical protein
MGRNPNYTFLKVYCALFLWQPFFCDLPLWKVVFSFIFGDYPLLYSWCSFLHWLQLFSIIIDFLLIMYKSNSMILTCTNLNLAFPFFEFWPRVQNPVSTFKPASHPIITQLSAVVIGNPSHLFSFSPALFLSLYFCYQQPTNNMPSGTKKLFLYFYHARSTGSRPLSQKAEPQ